MDEKYISQHGKPPIKDYGKELYSDAY